MEVATLVTFSAKVSKTGGAMRSKDITSTRSACERASSACTSLGVPDRVEMPECSARAGMWRSEWIFKLSKNIIS